ncbi:GNAT family N-acetyltransferase [Paenibacillus mesophilus]|uniref:GNAT family N-acetyltransferase n=1 Tax=Paenibacillus mesophilus TaxID=2582849 RepID=UPI00110D87C8|nr:GNAT family N-acetyltransferase [Paenibacillus mesophilus]TMV45965.1 GNAT family N-acetyltransferase [Paenibacillus mesophilus]
MSYTVRECDEEDFGQVTAVSRSVYAKKPGSFSLVSDMKDSRMLKKYVVTDHEGQTAGYGLLWEQYASPNLILKVEILFRREYRNELAVDALFDKITDDIHRIHPYAVQARTFDDQTRLLHFYEKYGFAENHRMVHTYLGAADADLAPYAELENRLRSQGITITTMAREQIRDKDWFPKLQTLNSMTWADYPSEPLLPPAPPNDKWLTHKDNIPEAFFIARTEDKYVGYSQLMRMEQDSEHAMQGPTATLGEYRGKGVATALKVKGIEYAKASGYKGIYTSYRNVNIPMKAVNDKLGWLPYSSEIRLEKRIEGA